MDDYINVLVNKKGHVTAMFAMLGCLDYNVSMIKMKVTITKQW